MNNDNAVEILNKEKGRYVAPHERRAIQQQSQQSSQPILSNSGSKWSSNSNSNIQPRSTPLSQSGGFRSGSGSSLNTSGSFSRNNNNNWSPNNSQPNSGQNSPRGSFNSLNSSGGVSKWSSERGVSGQYQSDGLYPANPRLEAELFEGCTNSGLNFQKYADIEVESHGESIPAPMTSFDDYNLGPVLTHNIKLASYTIPTPVQQHGIPIIINGRDLMACAQTGSGKTNAFLFPMIADMCKNMTSDGRQQVGTGSYRNSFKVFPTTLILAPTRELAIQIHQEARKFTYRSHIRSVVVYGGADSKAQIQELERGCHVLVATPGRLIDMI
jgi:ATP-dependent RNA helicase DDX3X